MVPCLTPVSLAPWLGPASLPTADVVCYLASSGRSWCTGSLTLAHEYTPTAGFRDCWLALLRCPGYALHDYMF